MLRSSTKDKFSVYIDEIVNHEVEYGHAKASFGAGDDWGHYALVDMSAVSLDHLTTVDERRYLREFPWAIIYCGITEDVEVTYYESERDARREWAIQQESYDQYVAECDRNAE